LIRSTNVALASNSPLNTPNKKIMHINFTKEEKALLKSKGFQVFDWYATKFNTPIHKEEPYRKGEIRFTVYREEIARDVDGDIGYGTKRLAYETLKEAIKNHP